LFATSGLEPFTFANEQPSGRDGTVRVTTDRREMVVAMKRVDGVWVPASVADVWESRVAATRRQLEEAADGSIGSDLPVTAAADSFLALLTPLEQAASRDDFHRAMQPLLAFIRSTRATVESATGIEFGSDAD
jgi:hypothetical protein